ncbi:MAG: DUF2062 domain-containing protein [Phycisphaera sp.]|nr:DUF2062 domain-containing protein [Phycisphaera sp.]
MRRRTRILFKYWWRSAQKFIFFKVLHTDDPPYRLAMGVAIGLFMGIMPIMGIQMIGTFFLAWLFRANKLVGQPFVWVSNPLTAVPVYYPCYLLGAKLMVETPVKYEWFVDKIETAPPGWWDLIRYYSSALLQIAEPLFLGCTVVAFLAATPTYFIVKYGVIWYRLRRWGQLIPPTSPRAQKLQEEMERRQHAREASSDNQIVHTTPKAATQDTTHPL